VCTKILTGRADIKFFVEDQDEENNVKMAQNSRNRRDQLLRLAHDKKAFDLIGGVILQVELFGTISFSQ